MRSLESKEVMYKQLSLFGLRPTSRMHKQPSEVTLDINEIACPTKEFIYHEQ